MWKPMYPLWIIAIVLNQLYLLALPSKLSHLDRKQIQKGMLRKEETKNNKSNTKKVQILQYAFEKTIMLLWDTQYFLLHFHCISKYLISHVSNFLQSSKFQT